MHLEELTLGEVSKLLSALAANQESTASYLIKGEQYLIRTVTMTYTGRVTAVSPTEVVLADAAWIADTGRFATALIMGTLAEVEPYPDEVIVSRAAIVDAAVWKHPLPRDQV